MVLIILVITSYFCTTTIVSIKSNIKHVNVLIELRSLSELLIENQMRMLIPKGLNNNVNNQ